MAQRESVTRAAQSLQVAQPVVSGHIRSLEARLGARLFSRSGRGIVLTPAGEIAYRWATDVLERTREASEALDELTAGARNRVSVVISAGDHPEVSELVIGFQARHQEATVNLRQLPTEQAVEAVLAGTSDFALVAYCEGVNLDPQLRTERLRDDEVILVAAAGTEAPHPTTREDLAELPFVCTPAGSARRNFIDAELRQRGVERRRIVMEIGPEGTLHAAVRDGLGCALLSRSSVALRLAAGELIEVELPGGTFSIGFDLVSRYDLVLSPARRAFTELARAQLTPADPM